MPQLDISTYLPQIVWLVITFTVLLVVMWKVVVPSISTTLEARQRRISGNLEKAAEFKKDAEAALAAYESAMATARAEAVSVINEAKERLTENAQRRNAELGEKLSERIRESESRIDQAVKDASASMRTVAMDVAAAAVTRLTGETPDDTMIGGAVDAAMKGRG
ncbi:MAG: F0F1 ATP synthase subunit B' [Rhodospirillales bacterium]|nr:F0F1 ATP synthase subunit B' [Rhodospirillales bacterium]